MTFKRLARSGMVGSLVASMISCDGAASSPTQTVTVATVEVLAPTRELVSGQTLALQARATDPQGRELTGQKVRWCSSDSLVVSVSESGVITGRLRGTAQVTAAVGSMSASATFEVLPGPTNRVALSPDTARLLVGERIELRVSATDAAGNVTTAAGVSWSSSNVTVATVDADGRVQALSPGTANISATVGAAKGVAHIAVSRAPTLVTGILRTNTVWTLDASPYRVTGTGVQVAEGVTLTIEPGVEVQNDALGLTTTVEVFGSLSAMGSAAAPIRIDSLTLLTRPSATQSAQGSPIIALDNVTMIGGAISTYAGGATIRHCTLRGLSNVSVLYPSSAVVIEQNVFDTSGGIDVILRRGTQVIVRNNLFTGQAPASAAVAAGVTVSYLEPTAVAVVEYNSFLDIGPLAFRLGTYTQPGTFAVAQNFWGTTDSAVIQGLIYDHDDDLSVPATAAFQPVLNAPHENTPSHAPETPATQRDARRSW